MKNNKKKIRHFMNDIRSKDNYLSLIKDSSLKINFNILNNFNLLQYNSFHIYISNIYEINTHFLIKMLLKNNKIVSVPYIYNKSIFLPLIIDKKSKFIKNRFNIEEPIFDFKNIKLLKYDCIIIPCLCADINGHRIGYGKGYYDRFLSKNIESFKMILCSNNFLFDTIYPNSFDIKCDCIINENNIIYTK